MIETRFVFPYISNQQLVGNYEVIKMYVINILVAFTKGFIVVVYFFNKKEELNQQENVIIAIIYFVE